MIDNALVSIGTFVGEKCFHFGRGWRQADQIEIHAAQQCYLVCLGRWLEIGGFQLGENEMIDGIFRPALLLYCGLSMPLRRDECPVFSFLGR